MDPTAEEGASAPSATVIAECRAYALQQLEVAEQSELYTCGMEPFDADHPFYGVLVTREGLVCSGPMEVEYYTHKKQKAPWYHPELCVYCAAGVNSKGYVDDELSVEWKSVLPVCKSCRDEGALLLVRSKKRNGSINARRNEVINVPHAPIVMLLGGGGERVGLAAPTPTPRGARDRTSLPSTSRRLLT